MPRSAEWRFVTDHECRVDAPRAPQPLVMRRAPCLAQVFDGHASQQFSIHAAGLRVRSTSGRSPDRCASRIFPNGVGLVEPTTKPQPKSTNRLCPADVPPARAEWRNRGDATVHGEWDSPRERWFIVPRQTRYDPPAARVLTVATRGAPGMSTSGQSPYCRVMHPRRGADNSQSRFGCRCSG